MRDDVYQHYDSGVNPPPPAYSAHLRYVADDHELAPDSERYCGRERTQQEYRVWSEQYSSIVPEYSSRHSQRSEDGYLEWSQRELPVRVAINIVENSDFLQQRPHDRRDGESDRECDHEEGAYRQLGEALALRKSVGHLLAEHDRETELTSEQKCGTSRGVDVVQHQQEGSRLYLLHKKAGKLVEDCINELLQESKKAARSEKVRVRECQPVRERKVRFLLDPDIKATWSGGFGRP